MLFNVRRAAILAVSSMCILVSSVHATEGGVPAPFDVPPGMGARYLSGDADMAVVEFAGNFDRNNAAGAPNAAARAAVTREFYAHHDDAYDFLFFFTPFDYELGDASAFYSPVRNDTSGIGLQHFDLSDLYGSSGRLQGVIDMGPIGAQPGVLDMAGSQYGYWLNVVMHEILHRWAVYVHFIDPETGERSDKLLGHQQSHWSSLVHSNGSVQYGAKWLDNDNGTFSAIAERIFLSPLDLYLMGMISADEVPPFFYIDHEGSDVDREATTIAGVTVSGQRKNLDIGDIIAAEGARQPSVAASQKHFNAAFIIVTRPGQVVTNQALSYVNTLRSQVAERFAIMTGGRGILSVHAKAAGGADIGQQDDAHDDAGERETPYRTEDALAWLRSQQKSSGAWQDREATAVRDTLLVHGLLNRFDPLYPAQANAKAVQWLVAAQAEDNDGLARLSRVAARSTQDEQTRLAGMQGADGGWALLDQQQSSVLDTALALQALRQSGGFGAATARASAWLAAAQNSDGGWGVFPGGKSQLLPTVEAARALAGDDGLLATSSAASDWLAGMQQADGGFDDGSGATAHTAQVLLALSELESLAKIQLQPAVTYLQARQGANGSWHNSVHDTALAVEAIDRIRFHNWSVSELVLDSDTVRDGDFLQGTLRITNDGALASPTTTVSIYLGDPPDGGVLIETLEVPALGIGQSTQMAFQWSTLGAQGNQQIYVVINPDGEGERTHLDNQVNVPVEILPAPEGVELIASAIDILPGSVSSLPETLALSAVVRNAGATAATSVTVQWWMLTEVGETLISEQRLDLPARSDRLLTETWLLEEAGNRRVRVVVDPEAEITEENRHNNTSERAVSVTPSLDIAVGAATLDGTAAFGETVTFTIPVHNRGTLPSPSFQFNLSIGQDDTETIIEQRTLSLAGGETHTVQVPWTVNSVGTLRVVAEADPAQMLVESSRDNNRSEQTFSAEVVEGSNLAVSHAGFTLTPEPLLEGQGAVLRAVVKNKGNLPAQNVRVAFYSGNPSEGGRQVAQTQIAEVAAASESVAEGVWPLVSGAGERVLYVVVDPDHQIAESSRDDNIAFRTVTVSSLPDLTLGAGSITLTPSIFRANASASVSVEVSNIGQQAVDNAVVALYVGGTASGEPLDTATVAVQASGTATVQFSIRQVDPGWSAMTVVLDPDDAVEEMREDNNSQVIQIAVQTGDLYLDETHISPNGDGIRDSVRILVSRNDVAPHTVSIETPAGESVLENVEPDEAVSDQYIWSGRNEPGGVVSDGEYRVVLRDASGSPLAQAGIIVDTNRSSLTQALLNPERANVGNLTCNIATDSVWNMRWLMSGDEQQLLFNKRDEEYYPGLSAAVYRSAVNTQNVESVAALSQYAGASYLRLVGADMLARRVAVAVTYELGGGVYRQDVIEKISGALGNGQVIQSYEGDVLDVQVHYRGTDGEKHLFVTYPDRVDVLLGDTGQLLYREAYPGNGQWDEPVVTVTPGPDGSAMLVQFQSDRYSPDIYTTLLLDLNTRDYQVLATASIGDASFSGDPETLLTADDFFCEDTSACRGMRYPTAKAMPQPVWSPDGERFALASINQTVRIYHKSGAVLSTHELPSIRAGLNFVTTDPAWSSDGARIAFYHGGGVGESLAGGYLSVLDTGSGNLRRLMPFHYEEIIASYHIAVENDGQWETLAKTHHPRKFAERTADLRRAVAQHRDGLSVRITQRGLEEGHIDEVLMNHRSGRKKAPDRAILLETGEDILGYIQARDYRFLDIHEKTIELQWDADPGLTGVLHLYAQEDNPSQRIIEPFSYPAGAGDAYTVAVPEQPSPSAVRMLDLPPLFEQMSRPDTVHKAAMVRGYAYSDGEYLHAAVDFAVDTTREDRGDWASVSVQTSAGERTFVIDGPDNPWGTVAFRETDKAPWPHRYYEFRIPLTALAGSPGQLLKVRFNAYGSAGLINEQVIDYYGDLLWLPADNALLSPNQHSGGYQKALIRFDDAQVTLENVLDDASPTMQLSPQGRRLLYLVWDIEEACRTPGGNDYAGSIHLLDTFDNLTVDLRALREPGGRGFRVYGTATDINFDTFRLEYRLEDGGTWRPVRPPGREPFVDQLMTTWQPPAPGRYLLRLTATDKAGNTASVSQRVISSEQSPISDVYVDADLHSALAAEGNGLGINFTVRAPVNLAIEIYRDDVLVRSVERGYDLIGEQVQWFWDGRDESGRLVPDGTYRIRVLGMEYLVVIDNTPPLLQINPAASHIGCHWSADPVSGDYVERDEAGCGRLALDYRVWVLSQDTDIQAFDVAQRYTGEQEWTSLPATALTGLPNAAWSVLLSESAIANAVFRATATDKAGNVSTVEFRPETYREKATLVRMGKHAPDPVQGVQLGEVADWLAYMLNHLFFDDGQRGKYQAAVFSREASRFLISETIAEPVVEAFVEYRIAGADWTRSPVSGFLNGWDDCARLGLVSQCADIAPSPVNSDDGRIYVTWDMSVLPESGGHIRIVLVTSDQQEILTQEIPLAREWLFLEGPVWHESRFSNISIKATAYDISNLVNAEMFISSADDARYRNKRKIADVLPGEMTPMGAHGQFIAPVEMAPCKQYEISAVYHRTDGGKADRTLRIKRPCQAVQYKLLYPAGPVSVPDEVIEVEVVPESYSSDGLKSLEIYIQRDDDVRDMLVTDNTIVSGETRAYSIEAHDWPAGVTEATIAIINDRDERHEQTMPVYVDRAAPEIELVSPLEGAQQCLATPARLHYSDRAALTPQSVEGWPHEFRAVAYLGTDGAWPAELSLARDNLSTKQTGYSDSDDALPALWAIVRNEAGNELDRFNIWKTAAGDLRLQNGQALFRGDVTLQWQPKNFSSQTETVTLSIEAIDATGNTTVLNREILLDAKAVTPEIDLAIDGLPETGVVYFSPNDDGTRDQLDIGLLVDEPGELGLSLYRMASADDLVGEHVGDLYQATVLPGRHVYQWDGRHNGQPLAEGYYRLVPALTDACGNQAPEPVAAGRLVVIDTTAPQVTGSAPAADTPLALVAHSAVAFEEAFFDPSQGGISLSLQDMTTGAETALDIDREVSSAPQYRYVANWGTFGHQGAYTLNWRLQDRAGNTAEASIPVTVVGAVELLHAVDVLTPYFSARNADTQPFVTRLGVLEAINAQVGIVDDQGNPVRTIHDGPLAPGDRDLTWDGRHENGVLAANGHYRITVHAVSGATSSLIQEEQAAFIVDNTAPDVTGPVLRDGFLQSPYGVVIGVTDAYLSEYQATLTYPDGTTQNWEAFSGTEQHLLLSLAEQAEEGGYRLTVRALDKAGNVTQREDEMLLDKTLPLLAWEAPLVSLVGGPEEDRLFWRLTQEEAHPHTLQVALFEPGQQIPLLASTPAVTEQTLDGEFALDGLDGEYRLRAELSDLAGNSAYIEQVLSIDTRAPVTQITVPAENDFVTASPMVAEGEASDRNLVSWALSLLSPSGDVQQELGAGVASQTGVLGTFGFDVDDGEYALRLVARDAAGFETETRQTVIIDTTPPAPPGQPSLAGPTAGQWVLSWPASPDDDVAHYQVRSGHAVLAEALTSPSWSFVPMANNDYLFIVVAVDHAGLESDPSPVLRWTLDTQGPTVMLMGPANGDAVSGTVDIRGSAFSDDFQRYELHVAPVGGAYALVSSGTLPLRAERLGQWDSFNATQDGDYAIRLRAWDLSGNLSETQIVVTVDNQPPEPVTALVADVAGRTVSLAWQASVSGDVRGYLITRNGSVLGASGPVIGDVTRFLITATESQDEQVPDGTYEYAVYTYDQLGNVSAPAAVEATVEQRAPHITLSSPVAGEAFDQSLVLQIATEDQDISVVRYSYRAAGDSTWLPLAPDSAAAPFLYSWPTTALPHGSYDVRAEAWDTGGLSAVSPAVTVIKRDITPPAAPATLTARVTEDVVRLEWPASTDTDVVGYQIWVRDPVLDESIMLASVQSILTSLEVPDVPEGVYHIYLVAEDSAGNLSLPGPEAQAVVYTPLLDPIKGLTSMYEQLLSGTSVSGDSISVYRYSESDILELDNTAIVDQRFVFAPIPLIPGINVIDIQAQSGQGDVSKIYMVDIVREEQPGAVRELGYSRPDNDTPERVRIHWLPPANAPGASYLVRDDAGLALHEAEQLPLAGIDAWGWPVPQGLYRVFDGDPATVYAPADRHWGLIATLDEPVWVHEITLHWLRPPAWFRLQGDMNDAVVDIASMADVEQEGDVWRITFDSPYNVTGFTLEVTGPGQAPPALAEMTVSQLPLSQDTFFDYTGEQAERTFSVTALGGFGTPGPASEVVVQVGDWIAPEPVTLAAQSDDDAVTLNWTASASPDVAAYLVYRNGQPVANIPAPQTTHMDTGLPNGVYQYQVRPLDAHQNLGEYSNIATVTVSRAPPQTPGDLLIQPDPLTGCIRLSWQQGGPDVAEYIVKRRENTGAASEIARTTGTSWNDCDIYPGVQYSYQIVAVDNVGNQSDPSGEQSEYGDDVIAPEAPRIVTPVAGGEFYLASAPTLSVGGYAEPGATVELFRNGVSRAQVTARAGTAGSTLDNLDVILPWPSPDLAHGIVLDSNTFTFGLYSVTGRMTLREIGSAQHVQTTRWLDAGQFLVARFDGNMQIDLELHQVAGDTPQILFSSPYNGQDWVFVVAVPAQDSVLFARVDGVSGGTSIERVSLSGQRAEQVYRDDERDMENMLLSPDGNRLAWRHRQEYFVLDLATGANRLLSDCPTGGMAGWAEDADGLYIMSAAMDSLYLCRLDQPAQLIAQTDTSYLLPYENHSAGRAGFVLGEALASGGLRLLLHDGTALSVVADYPEADFTEIMTAGHSETDYVWATHISQQTLAFSMLSAPADESLAPGYFVFDDVPLLSGSSTLHVVAEDRFGNRSDPSLPIQVSYAGGRVSNLGVRLNAPAVAVMDADNALTVRVTNTGTEPMSGYRVALQRVTPDNQRIVLGEPAVPALQPGASVDFTAGWRAETAGPVMLEALLRGPADDVAGDDYSAQEVLVIEAAQPVLTAQTESTTALPGNLLPVQWAVSNPLSRDLSGTLLFQLRDAQGQIVGTPGSQANVVIPALARRQGQVSLPLPALLPGAYSLHVTYATSTADIAAAPLPLQWQEDLRATLAFTGSARHFTDNDTVGVVLHAAHSGASGVLSGASVAFVVEGPAGQSLIGHEVPLATLLPGDTVQLPFAWQTGVEPPGQYRLRAQLRNDEGVALASAEYGFTIVAGAPRLRGSLHPAADTVGLGQPIALQWQIDNLGNAALSALQVVVEMHRSNAAPATVYAGQLDLPVHGSGDADVLVGTQDLPPGNYVLKLIARGGEGGALFQQTLAQAPVTLRDIQGPVVTVLSPEEGQVINPERVGLRALAQDEISGVASMRWRAAAQSAWQTMLLSGEGYEASLGFLQEGVQQAEIQAADHAGNLSLVQRRGFVVDRTAPQIQVTGITGGVFYNTPVQPVVNVQDAHPLSTRVSLNDAPWSGGQILLDDSYVFTVDAEDAAGNIATHATLFTLDMTPPTIQITGVTDGGLFNTAVTPAVQITDAHPRTPVLTLNGAPYQSGTPVTADGTYVLSVEAADLAGNVSQRSVTFTLDTTPPAAPVVSSPQPGQVLDGEQVLVAGQAEAAAMITLTYGGNTLSTQAGVAGQFSFAPLALPSGDYVITLTARDAADNVSDAATVPFTVRADVTPPVIDIGGADAGGYYNTDIILSVQISDDTAVADSRVRLNGQPYVSGTSILLEGSYLLEVFAVDEAGNEAVRELSFHIDRTAPAVSVQGVVDQGAYNAPVILTAEVQDASPVQVEELLNGVPFMSGGEIAAEGHYHYQLHAVDAAGNATDIVRHFSLDMTAPPAPAITTPAAGAALYGDVAIAGTSEPGATVALQIDDWQTTLLADTAGGFATQVTLVPGDYVLLASATDAAGNAGPVRSVAFSVRDDEIGIEPDTSDTRASVLLWHAASAGTASRNWYVNALASQGLSTQVVTTEQAFLDALETERYNVLVLVGDPALLGQPLYMDARTLMRVRGSVASGYGLVWVNTTPNLLETWHDMIGARTAGWMDRVKQVNYPLDDNEVLTLQHSPRTAGFILLGAQREGSAEPDCSGLLGALYCTTVHLSPNQYVASLINDYGSGRVKTLAFDPYRVSNATQGARVLADAIADVTPLAMTQIPHVPYLQRYQITRPAAGEPLNIEVSSIAPVSITPLGDGEATASGARWRVSGDVTQAEILYQVSAGTSGAHALVLTVTGEMSGLPLQSEPAGFVLTRNDSDLMASARDALHSDAQQALLSVPLWTALAALDNAIRAYDSGHYGLAEDKLYLAMLNLRLHLHYNEQTMAALGEFQRMVHSRQQQP